MSRGTTFWLLKKSGVGIASNFVDERISEYEQSCKCLGQFSENSQERDEVKNTELIRKHPRFLASGADSFDLLDSKTSIPYNIALEYTFNSIFGEVRNMLMDQYDMDSYDPEKSQLVISEEMARDMLVAVNYVLLEHFDPKIEKVMDNPFIDAIGTLSEKYSEYQYKLKFPEDKELFREEDNIKIIESLRTILSAFLDSDKSEGYVLVAEVWG